MEVFTGRVSEAMRGVPLVPSEEELPMGEVPHADAEEYEPDAIPPPTDPAPLSLIPLPPPQLVDEYML